MATENPTSDGAPPRQTLRVCTRRVISSGRDGRRAGRCRDTACQRGCIKYRNAALRTAGVHTPGNQYTGRSGHAAGRCRNAVRGQISSTANAARAAEAGIIPVDIDGFTGSRRSRPVASSSVFRRASPHRPGRGRELFENLRFRIALAEGVHGHALYHLVLQRLVVPVALCIHDTVQLRVRADHLAKGGVLPV